MEQFIPSWLASPLGYSVLAFTVYASLCNALRFRRVRNLERKYNFGTPERPFSSMTQQEAFDIQQFVSDSEFPALFAKALQVALLRTYGVPTIAKTLNGTSQLNNMDNVGKRYVDTEVLITEIYANGPHDVRTHEAFSRMNYIHGHYLKSGKVTNTDMLYTLALFMNQPVRHISQYEWRELTATELCAIGTFHKGMGEAMHLSYGALSSHKSGWRDGLHFYEELDTWADAYELQVMRPNKDSGETVYMTKKLFLTTVPGFTHNIVSQVVSAALDDRLREALMLDPASSTVKFGFNAFMSIRRFLMRYLALPRIVHHKNLSRDATPEGRHHVEIYGIQPIYVKPTFWKRWGPEGLFAMWTGNPRPGDEGMHPEGYLRSEVGPKMFLGKGKEFFAKEKKVVSEIRAGCPFMGAN